MLNFNKYFESRAWKCYMGKQNNTIKNLNQTNIS